MTKKKDTAKTETAKAHEVSPDAETFKKETGFDVPKFGCKNTEKRKCDILRIRKSNTRNSLFENELGKKFITAARAEVKNSEIQEDKDWFIIWEVLED